jgi:hypothetical protein
MGFNLAFKGLSFVKLVNKYHQLKHKVIYNSKVHNLKIKFKRSAENEKKCKWSQLIV